MNKKILLVDDDEIFNLLSVKMLNRMGINENIHLARNGREALKFINGEMGDESVPDIIFLDLNMPVLNGFGFIEEFRKMSPEMEKKVTIAILTSSLDKTDIERARQMGIQQYLMKPVSEIDMKEVLDNA